jgi:TonB family protein
MIRPHYVFALSLAAILPGFAQTAANAGPGLPKDPHEVFAAAAPFYDFTSPELKPWHLKATYQLYNDNGKPSEQGTYEYWWVSPKIHRSTWTRPGATRSDWQTADSNYAHLETGERLGFFEERLSSDLLSPLPATASLDPAKVRLDRETMSLGKVKVPCIMVIPLMPQNGQKQTVPLGSSPTYCFDPELPVLRFTYDYGSVTTEFNHIVKVQQRYLAHEVIVSYGKRRLLSVTVDPIATLDPSDPALTPPADATFVKLDKVQIGSGIMTGNLLKKQIPVYPQEAKWEHISGTVLLQATIGKDGKIHDLRVVLSPSPLLAESALQAVSQWEYKPYLLNGEPVEVETTVNVIYSLGG